jgi:mono/diheme cytochrome c family protein
VGKRFFFRAVPALLLLPALGAVVGGWAVVTVEDLPDYFVASRPVSLPFMVRQHGVTPLKGVHPTLEARTGLRTVQAKVEPGKEHGEYVATFTLPEPGDWTISIYSGWGNSRLTLLPQRAIGAGTAAPPAFAANEQGRRLFVAKGCVGCHMRMEDDITTGESFAPALTGKRYPAEFLRRFLADPAANATHSGSFRMPNLALKQAEIVSLVAFLNSERVALH